jgi:hypothetical protein
MHEFIHELKLREGAVFCVAFSRLNFENMTFVAGWRVYFRCFGRVFVAELP